MRISTAAANVAADRGADIVGIGCRHAVKECRAAHDHPRRAKAALQGVMLDERLLHRMQRVALRQTLDRGDGARADIDGEHHARADRMPSTNTVHAPQAPRSQAILVPVRPSGPRNTSARVARGSTRSVRATPLTCKVTGTESGPPPDALVLSAVSAWARSADVALTIVAPAVVTAEPRRNERRDKLFSTPNLSLTFALVPI